MKKVLLGGCALLMAAPVAAQADVEFNLDGRIRYETAEQDGIADRANALTARHRFGVTAALAEGFTLLVEGENILHLVDDFNDTINGATTYPVIADPEATELNRAQIQYGFDGGSLTLGRQRLVMGDSRYLGNVGYRQNEQTFDAVRVNWELADGITADYAYLDRVHRIFGDDSAGGEWDLDAHFVQLRGNAGPGVLQFTGLWFENEDVAGLSTQTYAIRWQSNVELGDGALSYFAEYATQSEYGNNPGSFTHTMLRAEARYTSGSNAFWGGVESLEGDGFRGFSTPLATLHKFQGFADVFLVTPAVGVQDWYAGARFGFGDGQWLSARNLQIILHTYEGEQDGSDLGDEIDIVFGGRLSERVSLQAKYADYSSGSAGPASRERFAIMLNYSF